MSLTIGSGPFARKADAADINQRIEGPAHVLWFQDVPGRIRATLGGETLVDTQAAKLLHETRLLPTYYLPRSDVRFDLLEPTDHSTHCPFKGDARYWTIRVGDEVAENAVWGYDEVIEGAPDLSDYVAFYFGIPDHWYEEDEELVGHPRDPFHRIDARHASRTVVVEVDGTEVARSDRPTLVFETGLPTRYYLPREDWDPDALTASSLTSTCAYKGHASYNGVRTPAGEVPDLIWRYDDPLADAPAIAGLLAAPQEHEHVDVIVGEPTS